MPLYIYLLNNSLSQFQCDDLLIRSFPGLSQNPPADLTILPGSTSAYAMFSESQECINVPCQVGEVKEKFHILGESIMSNTLRLYAEAFSI